METTTIIALFISIVAILLSVFYYVRYTKTNKKLNSYKKQLDIYKEIIEVKDKLNVVNKNKSDAIHELEKRRKDKIRENLELQFELKRRYILRGENVKRKNQVHSFQNSFTKFLYFIRIKDIETANDYATKSAKYYRSILNIKDYDESKWSLSNELILLENFFELENIPRKDIELKFNFNTINIANTKFVHGIFSTLLHNSMKHGFKDSFGKNIFKIEAYKNEDVLYFEISDNGQPSNYNDYLPDDGEENGLKLIKKQIEAIVDNKITINKDVVPFSITPIPGKGTIVKFIFPYEEI